jgi:hypothetical protein
VVSTVSNSSANASKGSLALPWTQEDIVRAMVRANPQMALATDIHGCIPFEKILTDWVHRVHNDDEKAQHSASLTNGQVSRSMAIPTRLASSIYQCGKSGPTKLFGWLSSVQQRQRGEADQASTLMLPEMVELGSSFNNEMQRVGPTGISEDRTSDEISFSQGLDTPAHSASPQLQQATRSAETATHQTRLQQRFRAFPAPAHLSDNARWAIAMLSAILDDTRRFLDPVQEFSADYQTASTTTTSHDEIIRRIAAIPDMVKTVLLLSDEGDRQRVLGSSLFQRVLLHPLSVGRWLTAMLQSDENRGRALGYLALVSCSVQPQHLTKKDPFDSHYWNDSDSPTQLVGPRRRGFGRHVNSISAQKEELYREVSRLHEFVPSLLSLNEQEMEEAAVTTIVRRVLDRIISRPFAVTVVFCDGIFLVLLLTGFRGAVSRLLEGRPEEQVLSKIYVANAGIYYFVMRAIASAVSLAMITRTARTYFWSFWNITDLLATLLALVSTVAIRYCLAQNDGFLAPDSNDLRNTLAVTTGFLWLRVLSFLKGINMQLATFVLAIHQVSPINQWCGHLNFSSDLCGFV